MLVAVLLNTLYYYKFNFLLTSMNIISSSIRERKREQELKEVKERRGGIYIISLVRIVSPLEANSTYEGFH